MRGGSCGRVRVTLIGSTHVTSDWVWRNPVERDPVERDPVGIPQAMAGIPEAVLVCGHSHEQWMWQAGECLALNPGSVAADLTGDPRAKYALLEWDGSRWQAQLAAAAARHAQEADRIEKGEGTLGKLSKDAALYESSKTALERFATLAEQMDKGQGTMGKLLKDPGLYNNLDQSTAEITKLLYDLRQDPKKYLTIRFRLF